MRDRPRPNQHLQDIQTLTATELRSKYPREYDSWRNMKQRKGRGYVVAPEFDRFADFLGSIGPQPASLDGAAWTIDRIDPSDPEYAPGKCRWLDKRGQANNRQRTIFLECDGERLPLTVWAERTGQKANTLRQRHAKGWDDRAVIHGKPITRQNPFTYRPWPSHKFAQWEQHYLAERRPSEWPFQYYVRRLGQAYARLQDELELFWDCPGYEERCAELVQRSELISAERTKALDRLPFWEKAASRWGERYGVPSDVSDCGGSATEDD